MQESSIELSEITRLNYINKRQCGALCANSETIFLNNGIKHLEKYIGF